MTKPTFTLGLTFMLLTLLAWDAASARPIRAAPDSSDTSVIIQPPCNQASLQNAIEAVLPAGGGKLTFNCGAATILITSQITIDANIEIDGAGKITLAAGNANRLFNVLPNASLSLKAIVLTNGYSTLQDGGAIFVDRGTLHLDHTTIQNSTAVGASGGAIKLQAGTLSIIASDIRKNTASNGGGISGFGVITVSQSTIAENSAGFDGGGLNVSGTITIQNSNILSNVSSMVGMMSEGGGLTLRAPARTTIQNSKIAGNTSFYCGGIANHGTATIDQVFISGNVVSGNGGGLCAFGQESVTNSSIVANRAFTSSTFGTSGNGGGIVRSGSFVSSQFTNVTISGNLAGERGGGMYIFNGSVALNFVTLYSNTAMSTGGGIYHTGSLQYALTLKNTVVAQNAGADCAKAPNVIAALISNGFNLAGDTTCPFDKPADITNANPKLAALANNGGFTPTHLPFANSPVLDKGQCVEEVTTDQRGGRRPTGPSCDIGAVEYGAVLSRAQLPIVIR